MTSLLAAHNILNFIKEFIDHTQKLNDLLIVLEDEAKNKLLLPTSPFLLSYKLDGCKVLNENFVLLSDNSLVSCFYFIFRVCLSTIQKYMERKLQKSSLYYMFQTDGWIDNINLIGRTMFAVIKCCPSLFCFVNKSFTGEQTGFH